MSWLMLDKHVFFYFYEDNATVEWQNDSTQHTINSLCWTMYSCSDMFMMAVQLPLLSVIVCKNKALLKIITYIFIDT